MAQAEETLYNSTAQLRACVRVCVRACVNALAAVFCLAASQRFQRNIQSSAQKDISNKKPTGT